MTPGGAAQRVSLTRTPPLNLKQRGALLRANGFSYELACVARLLMVYGVSIVASEMIALSRS